MSFPRAAGILLHPTSLPGPGGIGDLGPAAHEFLETLARAEQSIWQILPLGPTGFGDSPYQGFSAFAGNPRLVSPERLVEEGLLTAADLDGAPAFPADRVDFGSVGMWRAGLLGKAYRTYRAGNGPSGLESRLDEFLERSKGWIHDYALFTAVKESQGGVSWVEWPEALRRRDEAALETAWSDLFEAADRERFAQFLFFEQWAEVRTKARELGIEILGDVPIFVAADSADVWANPELFDLDDEGRPRVVAGVPPDYFSATGQLWGNPLYRWDIHAESGYSWWGDRMRSAFDLADRVRIDHFRGFENYWEIPVGEETAVNGRWVDGPKDDFFEALRLGLGELPIVAEDLGEVTPGVYELRDRWGFPGMRILQFAFGPDAKIDEHSPHLYPSNSVVYTGTHDNDTTVGWFRGGENTTEDDTEKREQRERALTYLGSAGEEIHWDMIRLALTSVADTAIVPMQDVLGLGSEARMNVPGRPDGNWAWRMLPGQWTEERVERLAEITVATGRGRGSESVDGEEADLRG